VKVKDLVDLEDDCKYQVSLGWSTLTVVTIVTIVTLHPSPSPPKKHHQVGGFSKENKSSVSQ